MLILSPAFTQGGKLALTGPGRGTQVALGTNSPCPGEGPEGTGRVGGLCTDLCPTTAPKLSSPSASSKLHCTILIYQGVCRIRAQGDFGSQTRPWLGVQPHSVPVAGRRELIFQCEGAAGHGTCRPDPEEGGEERRGRRKAT